MGKHTFDHLHVVWNKAYIILYFEARVSRIFEDEVSSTYMKVSLLSERVHRQQNGPFSRTVGLTYASGALTATWAKLQVINDSSVNQATHAHLRITSRCARTSFNNSRTGVYVAASKTSILGLSEEKQVQTRNRYNFLYQSTLGTRIGFGCLLILHGEVL
jgi:hypothetical protein